MTIATTLDKLQARLQAITTPSAFKKVYSDPREAVDIGSFPTVVLALDPEGQHVWKMAASGLARHQYNVAIWVFVGSRQQPLGELHSRALQWPEPIATALYSGLTLDNAVEFMGDGTDLLTTYTIGVEEWAGKELFRLKFSLPIVEKIRLPMNP